MTDTLYDLLGALPLDDSEHLRTAFRKAVKGAHPDLNPGDPDAALKFRRIVHANEILSDGDQRAVYDHLLDLASTERRQASHRAVASTLHRLASSVLGLVGLAALTVGSYLLLMHISAAPLSAPVQTEANTRNEGRASEWGQGVVAVPAMETAAAPICLPAPDAEIDRGGLLQGAFADLDRAVDPDLRFTAAYIDRNIIFYRATKSSFAFAEFAPSRRADKNSHLVVSPAAARGSRERSHLEVQAMPMFVRRNIEPDPSRMAFNR